MIPTENTAVTASVITVDRTGRTSPVASNVRIGKGSVDYTSGNYQVGEQGDEETIAATLAVSRVQDGTLAIIVGDSVLLGIDGRNYKVKSRDVIKPIGIVTHYEYKLALDTRSIKR